MIKKSALLAPVHAIVYAFHKQWIIAGRACQLVIYDLLGNLIYQTIIFDNYLIHGFFLRDDMLVIYGQKSLTIFDLNTFTVTCSLEDLDDFILDSFINNDRLIVGYAHNFIDIFKYIYSNDGKIICSPSQRLQCSIVCVLFSLSIIETSNCDIGIISGTVFGDIIYWQLSPSLKDGTVEYTVKYNKKGHAGVVFRIKWDTNRERFATTSDDRSVRIWNGNNGDLLTTCWGHTCRTWDASFCGFKEELLASSSEEGDVRIWHTITGELRSILKGHGKNLWCVVSLPSTSLIATAGNDSCIKLWDYGTAREISTENPTAQRIIPIGAEITKTDGSRRSNGVSYLKVHPKGGFVILIMLEGLVWRVQLGGKNDWTLLVNIAQPIINADVAFSSGEDCSICCSHPGGLASYFRTCSNKLFVWKAHDVRVINIWFPCTHSQQQQQQRQQEQQSRFHELVVTSTIKGLCTLWEVTEDSAVRINSFVTDKGVIASCCLMLSNNTLIIGDSRGGLSFFTSSLDQKQQHREKLLKNDQSQSIPEDIIVHIPTQVLSHMHGIEIVSLLQECDYGFCSLGHDGSLRIYKQHEDQTGTFVYICVSILSCLPIKSPDALLIHQQGSDNDLSFFIGGYVGSQYIIYDIRRQYVLMETEAGGWKRPHSSVIITLNDDNTIHDDSKRVSSIPAVIFACPVPYEDTNQLCLLDSMHTEYYPNPVAFSFQIGSVVNSLESNCCTMIPTGVQGASYLLSGGEDGCIRVYEQQVLGSSSGGLDLLQSVEMSHNVPVKTLSSCVSRQIGSSGIVVAGGGRLQFCVWSYDVQLLAITPLQQLLRLQYTGSTGSKALQDHRILSSDCVHLHSTASGNIYAILLCDSRGKSSLLVYDDGVGATKNLAEFDVSEYPILSCGLIAIESYSMIKTEVYTMVAMGDSNGVIHVIGLHVSLSDDGICDCTASRVRSFSYAAHVMGANTLSLHYNDICSELTIASGGDDQGLARCIVNVRITTELDGSSCGVKLLLLERKENAVGSAIKGSAFLCGGRMFCTVGYDQRLYLWRLPDHRSSVHHNRGELEQEISASSGALFVPSITEEGFEWLSGCLVNIGDVEGLCVQHETCSGASLDSKTAKDVVQVMVVGQGIQLFSVEL